MTNEELEFKGKLELLIKTTSKSELADHFGISRQAFYKWLKKYGIKYIDSNKSKGGDKFQRLNEIADKLLSSLK